MGAVLFLADPVVHYYLKINAEEDEFGLVEEVPWNDSFRPPEVESTISVSLWTGWPLKVKVLRVWQGEEETTAGKRKCLNIMVRAI